MKLGVIVALGQDAARPEFLDVLGAALEERGVESLWVPEHVVLFDAHRSAYPYTEDGTMPIPSDLGLLDPFVALTYLAARTSTLRLATGICLIGQRNPVYTAKQVADLDVLSRGRVEFGVGLGWLREEYEAVGVPWRGRGARVDEYLRVMRTLWDDEVSAYDGDLYELRECRMYPKPVQAPHPPVHVGGESEAAMRRVARLGDGWFGMNHGVDSAKGSLARLDRALAEAGRDRASVSVSLSPPPGPPAPGLAAGYRDLGADRMVVSVIARDRDELLRGLDRAVAGV
jgi:probable F420-dependent oxidoreductase